MIVQLVALTIICAVACLVYVAVMRAARKPYQYIDPFGGRDLPEQEVLEVSRFDIIDIDVKRG